VSVGDTVLCEGAHWHSDEGDWHRALVSRLLCTSDTFGRIKVTIKVLYYVTTWQLCV